MLTLLAQELPKLVNLHKAPFETPELDGRGIKRRRLQECSFQPSDTSEPAPLTLTTSLMDAIINAYFTYIHPWIPMIHQSRFIQNVEQKQGQIQVILQAMILAASKFVPEALALGELHSRIRRWIICTAMDSIRVQNLQALIIVTYNDIGSGDAARAWSIIGSMTRSVEFAQLTQEQKTGGYKPFCQPRIALDPAVDWTEEEERRRVFWNVFLLDRFCSMATGCNASLTSTDVCRRLPCDGHLWRKETEVVTPYLGIWDRSKEKIGQPIGYLYRLPSPSSLQPSQSTEHCQNDDHGEASIISGMASVGAFAYNVEATESMNRVMTHFLKQKIDHTDHSEINSWLTRFKELDLRLVHWKMLLPQKWKANPNLTKHVPLMDPNLTTAHVLHNASMILLHQIIAFPPSYWNFRNRLPSTCSAEACYSAGVEISTITKKYISKSLPGSPVGFQYAVCLYLAGRSLLCYWHFNKNSQLCPEFWSILESLAELSARWVAFSGQKIGRQDIFTMYASHLKRTHEACTVNPAYRLNVMDYIVELNHDSACADSCTNIEFSSSQEMPTASLHAGDLPVDGTVNQDANLDFLPQPMLDNDFEDIDRIITFDDGAMFAAACDTDGFLW